MAFSNGTYSLVSGNPVVTGTTISSTWANNTLDDIADALTLLGHSVTTGITAAGSTQGTATALASFLNVVSTATALQGVRLSSSWTTGFDQTVFNQSGTAIKVYPPTGFQINELGTNAAMILADNTAVKFYQSTSTQWIGILSA